MKKKLIEVALPLEAINVASAREKSIRHGHPSTLHLWWARRPLAACRAVLFASLVDDPSSLPDEFPTEDAQEAERQRLFRIIERLVKWENSNNPEVLAEAHAEIMKSTGGNPPPVLDPFCGGGSIPLEAQRLGLEAHGSDLNPIPVLITKALIEIPPKFAGQPPINPESRKNLGQSGTWTGATGLAEDVRYYGKWMRDEAERRIGHLYPKVILPKEQGGGEATVIAWVWARTVKCPNPACRAQMPLITSFWLSKRDGQEAWLQPVINNSVTPPLIKFKIEHERPSAEVAKKNDLGTGILNSKGKKSQATFRCAVCNEGIAKGDYIDAEADQKRLNVMPLALVAAGKKRRYFLPFDDNQLSVAMKDASEFLHSSELQEHIPTEPAHGTFASNAQGRMYGFKEFADYFTDRQLVSIITFSDLVWDAHQKIVSDFCASADKLPNAKSNDANAYADAIALYLAFAVDRLADLSSSTSSWIAQLQAIRSTFARQAISMAWDFVECNPTSDKWLGGIDWITRVLDQLPTGRFGSAIQKDAAGPPIQILKPLISTDPPYYGNVAYADLSDFFYIWLRRSLRRIYPSLLSVVLTPKAEELVATPFKFAGDRERAKSFFEVGLGRTFSRIHTASHPEYPTTVYYAFKQTDNEADDEATDNMVSASTGWETMLEGLLHAKFQITGTWPMRTERSVRNVAIGSNALASSVILVCRPRPHDAPIATRREFVTALRRELEDALLKMMHGNIAPVDLAQATIGPGMAVYSRYSKVIETNGEPLRVRTALQIINQELDTILSATEGDYDGDTRFCLAWFEQFGMDAGAFGDADNMARAKNTSVAGLAQSGVLASGTGKVRLLKREEYPADWNPQTDTRKPVWECTQYLVRALQTEGEGTAARLCKMLGGAAEPARDLAYRLYSICERKGWASEALAYNSLVIAWPEITRLASSPNILVEDTGLFAENEL